MPLYYLDSTALVKLLRTENETKPLRAFVDGAELVSCELTLTELPRAIRRAATIDPALGGDALLAAAEELFEGIALRPVDRPLLAGLDLDGGPP